MRQPLVILQTADWHNNLGLKEAGRLRNLRVEHQALLLDCGDAIWAPNILVKPGVEHAILRMNEAGYHAMALGNREFFFRSFGMLMKTSEATFPVLSANLAPAPGRSSGHVQRWTVLTSPQGAKVGLFGLTPTMIPPDSWMEVFADVRFISHERATREALAALRSQCDWVVCLSHIGYERDLALAERFQGIDLILGGHSHRHTDDLVQVGEVTISHIGPYGREVGLIRSLDGTPRFQRRLLSVTGTGSSSGGA
jgi:2',3'-cyclic-nucleotide 2'-phosphodiesterase (5'-nucleotidase family)